ARDACVRGLPDVRSAVATDIGLVVLSGAVMLAASAAPGGAGVWHDYMDFRLVEWGLPAAELLLLCVYAERRFGWPHWPLLRRLGDASYSVYLSHFLTIGLVLKLLRRPILETGIVGAEIVFVVLIAASIIVGLIVHMALERPLLAIMRGGPFPYRFLHRERPSSRPRSRPFPARTHVSIASG